MDMSTYKTVPFNLECMKLSSYFKKQKEIVVLAREFNPERNQKFILRKDYDDGMYPMDLFGYDNVEYGGYAFTNGLYIPLPKEIEESKPDTSIYTKMEGTFTNGLVKNKRIFDNLMTAEHGRISLDGKTVWDDCMCQFKNLKKNKNLFLHDYDLGSIENGFEMVKEILGQGRMDIWATKIGMKFPIQINNSNDFLKWTSLNPNAFFYSIQYNGIIEMPVWEEYILSKYKKGNYSNLEYWVTNNENLEDFCGIGIRKILRQIIIARSNRVKFSLKYNDSFFQDKMWCRVLDMFQFFLLSMQYEKNAVFYNTFPEDTVYNFAKHLSEKPYRTYGKKSFTKSEAREIFNFIREKNYLLFKDLYECNYIKLKEEINDWY